MAANTSPIFSKQAVIQWAAAALTAANTAKDGTGSVATVFAADASEGGRIEKIAARAIGTNVATVLRVFVNNGSSNATPANNVLVAEMTLPATTLSEVAAQPAYELPLNLPLPPGYVIFCTIGTAVAAGYMLSGIGSKY